MPSPAGGRLLRRYRPEIRPRHRRRRLAVAVHEPHGTVLLPARQLVLLRQYHEYHDADEHTYRALAGEDDVEESREPPAGEASLRKSLSLTRMEASASFLAFF